MKEKPGPFAQVALLNAFRSLGFPPQGSVEARIEIHNFWNQLMRTKAAPEPEERVTKAELMALPVSGVTH